MVFLLLGVLTLLVLMSALGMFSRAQVDTIKAFGIWVAAIGGLLLAVLLFLTGRGATALSALALLGPLVWSWVVEQRRPPSGGGPRGASSGGSQGGGQSRARSAPPPRGGAMSREEAYAVLGLKPGATAEEIRAAHRRLMRAAHPDSGGSDWVASRVNQARDVLLG
jgi:hypothetical protein